MNANAPNPKGKSLLLRLRQPLCAFAGFLGITVGTGAATIPTAASAQAGGYQASGDAPAAWRDFAAHVQLQFRERLSSDDRPARQFARLLEDRAAADSNPQAVVAKVWVSQSGTVERLEFDALDHTTASGLRTVLLGSDLRALPPQDMLQPLRLKLSLGRPN